MFRSPSNRKPWGALALAMASALFAGHALGHGQYLLPSHFMVSGNSPQHVSLSASISNDFFHPDMPLGGATGKPLPPPMRAVAKTLAHEVVTPDGTVDTVPWRAMSRQSVADFALEDSGTYRFRIRRKPMIITLFEDANGDHGRVFGKDTPLPDGAIAQRQLLISSRAEAFVSSNTLDEGSFTIDGVGLELLPLTHPNDIFVDEPFALKLFLNGKPAGAGITITAHRGGTRYQTQRDVLTAQTDSEGKGSLTFATPGAYLIEVETGSEGDSEARDGDLPRSERFGLFLAVEVYPE